MEDRLVANTLFSDKWHGCQLKYQVTSSIADGFILHATPLCPGTVNDTALLHTSGILEWMFPSERLVVDRGYLGDNILPFIIRGFSGPQITAEQQEWNHLVSSVRIQVERTIGYLKKFRVFQLTYIHSWETHMMMFHLACHLVNFRIALYPSRDGPHPNIFEARAQKPY